MSTEKVVKVGVKQLNNPTPKALVYIFRAYTFLAGLWVLFQPNLSIPDTLVAEINKWILLGVPVIQYVIKFFGLDFKQQ